MNVIGYNVNASTTSLLQDIASSPDSYYYHSETLAASFVSIFTNIIDDYCGCSGTGCTNECGDGIVNANGNDGNIATVFDNEDCDL